MSLTVPTPARHLMLDGDVDRAPSRSDSVLDFYTSIPALSREPSPRPPMANATPGGRTIPQPVRIKQQHEKPGFVRASSDYHDYSWDENMPPQNALPRFRRPISSEFGAYHPISYRHNSLSKSDSLSRIPLYKEQPHRLNGTSLSESRKSAIVSSPRIPTEGEFHTGNNPSSQMPRSVSMPLNNHSNVASSDPQVKYGSLPSRTRSQIKGNSIGRSTSHSTSPRLLEVRDPKQLREDQARRLHAINNAPTGRPPWMNNFQPDPRLPADQQMLPTVARKLALERWVAEGGSEATFDIMWNQAPIANDTRPSSVLFETKQIAAVSPEAPPHEEKLDSVEGAMPEKRLEPEAGYTTNQIIGTSCLGQSPAHQLTVPMSAPNFSRRSVLNVSKSASQGSMLSDHLVGAESPSIQADVVPESSIVDTRPSLPAETTTHANLEHANHNYTNEQSTTRPQTKQKQTRPASAFDHEATQVRKSGCCLVM